MGRLYRAGANAATWLCADWSGAERMIHTAVSEFGDLHVLVNNAGILRDRMLLLAVSPTTAQVRSLLQPRAA